MAEGVRFDIAIEANSMGVDSSADQLNALAQKITFTSKVATEFDRAVSAVRSRLEEATAVTKATAAALATAEGRYRELENAANKAAKEVEKAALAGKDTRVLAEAAAAASVKMREQATAVDELRVKSDAAAAAQAKLTGTLKTLEGQQAQAAARTKAGLTKELEGAKAATSKLGTEGASDVGKLGKAAGMAGTAAKAGAVAWLAFAVGAMAGVASIAKFAMAQPENIMLMQRLTMASMRLQLGLRNLVSGLKFDKFVGALEDMGTLFDKGTSSAGGMKVLVETILQPLIDAAAKAGPYVKEMFKGLIYGAMQVVIAVLKIRNEIFKAMSPETRGAVKSVTDSVLTIENAFKLGAGIAVVLTAAFVALTVALVAFAVAEIAALWPILLVVAVIALIIAAIIYWSDIVDWMSDVWTDFVDSVTTAVDDVITGIVDGIKNGAGAVWTAMKNMASGAVKAFKDTLGIKSPSAVMRLQADYTTQGFVEGIEAGEAEVASAGESMATAATDGVSAAPGAASGRSPAGASSGTIITFSGPISFGSDADRSMFAEFTKMLSDALGGAAIVIGGGEAPAT